MNLAKIQEALIEHGLDGWLFYDFHKRDNIAARILSIDTKKHISRRWFYYIPSQGIPQKLNHAIEPWVLDHLPGEKSIYLAWEKQHQQLKQILGNAKKVAMQYSPNNSIPYISIVDAGTVELVRGFGVEVVSSADLVSIFESKLDTDEIQSHIDAGIALQRIKNLTFAEVKRRILNNEFCDEFSIQQFMHNEMKNTGLTWSDGPIVAVNEHAADPHYEPSSDNTNIIKEGDLLLLDLWAKLDKPKSIYYDITWMGFVGSKVPENMSKIFSILAAARDEALNFIINKFENKTPLYGWEIDSVCRNVVETAGYGQYFTHRTGHNIGEEVHGNGTHIDNLETKDNRLIIPGTCFSIEPGIYIPDQKIGFRTEIDVMISLDGEPIVYGDIQNDIISIMS